MKYCKNCGQKLNEQAAFCQTCGSSQLSDSSQQQFSEFTRTNTAKSKHSKRIFVVLLCIVLAVLLLTVSFMLGGFFTQKQSTQEQDEPATTTSAVSTTDSTTDTTTVTSTTGTPPTTVPATAAPTAAPVTTSPAVPDAPINGSYFVESEDGYVNLRSGPSLDHPRIGTIPNDTELVPTDSKGGWLLVTYGSTTGWVHTLELQFLENQGGGVVGAVAPYSGEYLPAEQLLYTHTNDGVNMRYGPSSADYSILCTIPYARTFYALAKRGDWYYVQYNGDLGWVHNSCVAPV